MWQVLPYLHLHSKVGTLLTIVSSERKLSFDSFARKWWNKDLSREDII